MGGSRGSWPKKFRKTKSRLQLNNFTQKLNFDVLRFKRRRAHKNQEEKKGKNRKNKEKEEKKLIAAKSGLVGIKGYLETYNHMKYFSPYLSRF